MRLVDGVTTGISVTRHHVLMCFFPEVFFLAVNVDEYMMINNMSQSEEWLAKSLLTRTDDVSSAARNGVDLGLARELSCDHSRPGGPGQNTYYSGLAA